MDFQVNPAVKVNEDYPGQVDLTAVLASKDFLVQLVSKGFLVLQESLVVMDYLA